MVYHPEQTIRIIRPEKEERRAMNTISHLDKAKLPARASTLAEVKAQLEENDSTLMREGLINITRSDPALFRMCLTEISKKREQGSRPKDLLEELHNWPLEDVHQLYTEVTAKLQSTALETVTGAERKQLERAAVRCVAAQEFSAKATIGKQLDSAVAHAAAFFSEIGSALIAAQYPRLFARVRNENKGRSRQELGIAIKKQLGITPEGIGIHYARQSGIQSEVIRELQTQERGAPVAPDQISPLGAALKTGELLADLHESNGSESAFKAYREFAPVLEVFLGSEGAESFSHDVQTATAKVISELRSAGPTEVTENLPQEIQARLLKNRFLSKCESGTRAEIEKVYSLLVTPGPSTAALRELLSIAIGRSGFIGGAVFRHFANAHEFKCLLRLGSKPAEIFDPAHIFSRWDFEVSQDGVLPIRFELTGIDGKPVDCFFGRFTSGDVAGVLALELSPELQAERDYSLNHFSALRTTLEECLK